MKQYLSLKDKKLLLKTSSTQPNFKYIFFNLEKYQDDNCLVALVDNTIVGAIWTRIMNDYGHVDNNTPSLAIAILKDYRNHGIGTKLILSMLMLLKQKGYKQVSFISSKSQLRL